MVNSKGLPNGLPKQLESSKPAHGHVQANSLAGYKNRYQDTLTSPGLIVL
jgi:hypothetical protein